MSSTRDLKKLLSSFDEAIKELNVSLGGVFSIGKPISPRERVAKADQILGLARMAVSSRIPLLRGLEEQIERVEERREAFIKANKLNPDNSERSNCFEEEPTNA